jgi:hypothetical protein
MAVTDEYMPALGSRLEHAALSPFRCAALWQTCKAGAEPRLLPAAAAVVPGGGTGLAPPLGGSRPAFRLHRANSQSSRSTCSGHTRHPSPRQRRLPASARLHPYPTPMAEPGSPGRPPGHGRPDAGPDRPLLLRPAHHRRASPPHPPAVGHPSHRCLGGDRFIVTEGFCTAVAELWSGSQLRAAQAAKRMADEVDQHENEANREKAEQLR